MRKSLLLSIFLLCAAARFTAVKAQQDPQLSLYMFNRQVLNPAYVGVPGAPQIVFAGRSQWVGIEGHPNTFTLSGNLPVPILRGGLGLHFMSDQIGPFSTNAARLSYAFRLPIGDDGKALQLGINPGFMFKQFDIASLRPQDSNDPRLINMQSGTKTKFDLGAGVYFTKSAASNKEYGEKYYIGLAMDHLTEPAFKDFGMTVQRHLYLTGGYRIDMNYGTTPLALTPSILFKNAGPLNQVDLNMNLHVSPMVFGLTYRVLSSDAIVALLGFHASQKLFVAYSYDYTLSALNNASSGSHEIVIMYTFPKVVKFAPPDLDTKQNPIIR